MLAFGIHFPYMCNIVHIQKVRRFFKTSDYHSVSRWHSTVYVVIPPTGPWNGQPCHEHSMWPLCIRYCKHTLSNGNHIWKIIWFPIKSRFIRQLGKPVKFKTSKLCLNKIPRLKIRHVCLGKRQVHDCPRCEGIEGKLEKMKRWWWAGESNSANKQFWSILLSR